MVCQTFFVEKRIASCGLKDKREVNPCESVTLTVGILEHRGVLLGDLARGVGCCAGRRLRT